MCYNDGGGPVFQGRGKYLPGMNQCSVYKPDGYCMNLNELAGSINCHTEKMFLLSITQISNHLKCILRTSNGRPFAGESSFSNFQDGLNHAGSHGMDALQGC